MDTPVVKEPTVIQVSAYFLEGKVSYVWSTVTPNSLSSRVSCDKLTRTVLHRRDDETNKCPAIGGINLSHRKEVRIQLERKGWAFTKDSCSYNK